MKQFSPEHTTAYTWLKICSPTCLAASAKLWFTTEKINDLTFSLFTDFFQAVFILQDQMVGLMIEKLDNCVGKKQQTWPILKYCSSVYFLGVRQITEYLSDDFQSPD
jgi:hypothetical protein